MTGEGALFTREGTVEAAWAVVHPEASQVPTVQARKLGAERC